MDTKKYYTYVFLFPNSKRYIGYSDNPKRRWCEEKSNAYNAKKLEYEYALSRAIRKCGWDYIDRKIVGVFNSQQEATLDEIRLIELYKTNTNIYGSKYGYNMTYGGDGGGFWLGKKQSPETILKRSISQTGKTHTDEAKKKQSQSKLGPLNPNYGKATWNKGKTNTFSHTEETKMFYSKIRKGRVDPNRKLDFEIANQIREQYKTKSISMPKLAKIYKVSETTIHRIIHNKIYIK